MALSKDFAAELERAVEVAARHTVELLRRPGVRLVGAGTQRSGGELTGRAAVVVTVDEKLSPGEIEARGWEALPEYLDEVPVDVVEAGATRVSRREEEATAAAREVQQRLAGHWLDRPNVTAVGVGYKIVGGRFTSRVAIQVYVAEKLSYEEIEARGLEPVPEEIEGIPTDVIEMPPQHTVAGASGSRGERRDPLVGGISVGLDDKAYSYGTLGALAFDSADAPVALTNEHVWEGSVGQNVVQPGRLGVDGFEVDFQLDLCNPLNFFRLDTPNTVGGSILAAAAAGTAIAAGLSDDIDPTREGQEATVPASGAHTLEEYTAVRLHYPEFPLPGTPFTVETTYAYERRTDAGTLHHELREDRVNRHYLLLSKVLSDRIHYHPEDLIRLYGLVIQDPANEQKKPRPCDRFHCVAHLYPVGKDEDYPVVLRPLAGRAMGDATSLHVTARRTANPDVDHGTHSLADQLSEEELEILESHRELLCVYFGEIPARNLPLGPWRKWMFVQTVNDTPPGTEPLVAARTIGGLPVSKNFGTALDVACGPFVIEDDGSFDIELFTV